MVVSGTSRLTGNVGVGRTATANALDVSGAIAVSGATTISGNLTVDTNTLFVNAASNRVGIGMNNPSVALDVNGQLNATSMSINSNQIFGARAWVCFNGTLSSGNIKASQNVSSVTRTTAGTYTINFTNEMPDTNYAVFAFMNASGPSGSYLAIVSLFSKSTTSVSLRTQTENSSAHPDKDDISVCVFR